MLLANCCGAYPGEDADPILGQLLLHHLGGFGILLGQDALAAGNEGHLGSQTGQSLAQLAAYRPRPYHRHRFGQAGQVKDRFVGQIARLGQARQGGNPRTGSGGDDKSPRLYLPSCHLKGAPIHKAALGKHQFHPQLAEAIWRIGVVGDVALGRANVFVHLEVIHRDPCWARESYPTGSHGLANPMDGMGHVKKGFAGHTAIPEAIAAQAVAAFHQQHLGLQLGRSAGHHQTRRTGADDHNIVGDRHGLF